MQLRKHARFLYQPVLPLGKNRRFFTGCKAHQELARQAATDGTVLLKNDGTLPLKAGAKICLFGIGAGDFLFGGGGSGRVFTQRQISLAEGLQDAARVAKIEFFSPLADFYTDALQTILEDKRKEFSTVEEYNVWRRSTRLALPVLPQALYEQAKAFGDTAIFCVSRYSSEGDNNGDRTGGEGDFYLWPEEKTLLSQLCADFAKVVVILNSCGPVSTVEYRDNDRVGAVLYPLYGGGEAGAALTEILLGEKAPSGHLQHTLARDMADYPSTAGFHDEQNYVNYTEDIFVGYRYFETFAPEKVVYPFGFGLSYTTFAIKTVGTSRSGMKVELQVQVENTGSAAGKQVIQAYLSAPQGKLGKAKKVLCAFNKTNELQPGQSCKCILKFDLRDFASFDDLGKVAKSAFVLETGAYHVSIGTNARDTEAVLQFTLDETVICRQCHSYMAPRELPQRLCADGSFEQLPRAQKQEHSPRSFRLRCKAPEQKMPLAKALEEKRLDAFLASLTDADLGEFLYGHPMMNASNTNGIGLPPRYERVDVMYVPLVPTADGPMGLRIREGRGVLPTYFPCENTVSQTWDLNLVRRIGKAVAREAKENNIGIWLAPALNIQRNPMCGRNFEYYSEDPLTSGLFATWCVKGVQSQNIAATVKHYCANNRENHRRLVDSRVSERALREIYLRGFEIVVKKAKPWALMTSYNPVNGEQSSKNWEAINGILRGEWCYDGVVMTDWRTLSTLEQELEAGSDVKMPELNSFAEHRSALSDVGQMITQGYIPRGVARASVRRILKLMDHLD